jgi:hypothetical protein
MELKTNDLASEIFNFAVNINRARAAAMIDNETAIREASKAIYAHRGLVSYDVNLNQWAQDLPCVFFHVQGDIRLRLTGYVNLSEDVALRLCNERNRDWQAGYMNMRNMFPMLSAVECFRALKGRL